MRRVTYIHNPGCANPDDDTVLHVCEEGSMRNNEMSKDGIQKLRDLVVEELKMNEFHVARGDANLVENVITLLHQRGKIQWESPSPEQVLILSPTELRSLADQCTAYGQIIEAGGGRNMTQVPLHVNGRELAYLLMSPEGYFVEIRPDDSTDWVTADERTGRYGKYEDDETSDGDDFE